MGLVIGWGKVDTQAKSNSNPTMEDKQPFSNIEKLKVDEGLITTVDYATVGELNQTILDNSQVLIEDSPNPDNIVLWSKSISNSEGKFKNNPILSISFNDVVTSAGIMLFFWNHNDEYCKEVKIRWYNASGTLISEKIFYPDNYEYACTNYVEQYKKLEIEFVKTCFPKRFVKLYGIEYGEKIKLTAKNIVTARLVEEIGITSQKLFTNQVECDIISLDDNFNIITNPGSYLGIQKNQQIEISSTETNKNYGTYFIQKSSVNGNIISLTASDLINYLESQEFKGGLYINTTFDTILNQIISQAKLTNVFGGEHNGFIVPDTIKAKTFTGYIPYTNCREALHQLCYAGNVVANCKRGEKIQIFEIPTTKVDTLDNTKLIMDSLVVENNDLFTGVSVNAYSYKEETEQKELENKIYEVGSHTIKFTAPYRNYTITGATITESGSNYVTFNVTTQGTIVIKGYGYEEVVQQFTANNPNYTGNVPSIKEMSNVKLIGPSIAQSVAEKQLSLYLLKYKLTSDIFNLNANIGDYVEIENAEGNIQQIETDLLAEDVCTVEVLGNAKSNNR